MLQMIDKPTLCWKVKKGNLDKLRLFKFKDFSSFNSKIFFFCRLGNSAAFATNKLMVLQENLLTRAK